jgi:hypothetical protein
MSLIMLSDGFGYNARPISIRTMPMCDEVDDAIDEDDSDCGGGIGGGPGVERLSGQYVRRCL